MMSHDLQEHQSHEIETLQTQLFEERIAIINHQSLVDLMKLQAEKTKKNMVG